MREINCTKDGLFGPEKRRNVVAVLALLVVSLLISLAATGHLRQDGSGSRGTNATNDEGEVDSDIGNVTMTSSPTASPSDASIPTAQPTDGPRQVTYRPGLLTVVENGMLLSKGLKSRFLAQAGEFVTFQNGKNSSNTFHRRPDGAAVFAVPEEFGRNQGGWVYVSNSEVLGDDPEPGHGGVGAMIFNKNGKVVGYRRLLRNTTANCSGGKTPWGTWISCEEVASTGQIYQVDPFERRPPELTSIGQMQGGRYEAFAYDDRNKNKPYFYVTEDQRNGPLRRFTPAKVDWEKDPWSMLHGNGTLDYLLLFPSETINNTGTFNWTDRISQGKQNAFKTYQSSEGIDRKDNLLYITCKQEKMLYILDLDESRYVRHSMEHGLFEGEPDQVTRILNSTTDILYFNEDSGQVSGVHARNSLGQFFTILEGTNWTKEATGLAFSPSGHHMYVCFQDAGVMFEITRKDGYPFQAESLDIRYHNKVVDSPWIRRYR